MLGIKVSCVLYNQPYMGSSKMNKNLSDFVKTNYPNGKSDMMTCFMEVGWSSIFDKGAVGMINLPSWLFLSSFNDLRTVLNSNYQIDSLLHMGRGIFGDRKSTRLNSSHVANSYVVFCLRKEN